MFTGEYTQEWLQWGANEMVRRIKESQNVYNHDDIIRTQEIQQARMTEVGMTSDQVIEAMTAAFFKNVLPTENP